MLMRIVPLALLFLALLVSGTTSVTHAQSMDSLAIRYHFVQGDSIRYRLLAYDSITIFDTRPRSLARERTEILTWRCDSVLPNGYVMTLRLDEYVARERFDTLPEVIRTTHDWLGRPITMLIGITGERIEMLRWVDRPGTAPGGPFDPSTLPYLGPVKPGATGVDEQGVFGRTAWLFDNVYPPVKWEGTSLRRFIGSVDTMGVQAMRVDLGEVGQVTYYPGGDTSLPYTHSRVNGSGVYFLSATNGYPVAGEYDLVADVTLTKPDTQQSVQTRHVIGMYFELYDTQTKVDATQRRGTPATTPSSTGPSRRR